MLDKELELSRFPVVRLSYPRLTGEEAEREVLRQLDVEHTSEPIDRKQRLGERLLSTRLQGGHTLVIVDEAQVIPDDEVLRELSRLLEFRLDQESLATLLLSGEPAMLQRLVRLPHFDQRFVVRNHLEPLDAHQTHAYIGYRLEVAGADRALFTDGALNLVYERSRGIPREINTVCDMSLFMGARKRAETITEEIVRRVA